MTSFTLFARLGLALAIGLLVGIERGWQLREERPGMRAAGVRTYALVGLLGGIWAALETYVGPVVLGFAALSFALCFALFAWGEERALNANSATGTVAGLVTFALGVLAVLGPPPVAASGAVAATLLLAERTALHTFVEELKWSELRAALILLVMTVILLPILPNRTVDPWGALNPSKLWLMTVSIAALSYVGYVSVRLLGRLRGLFFGAAAAAIVSSTAVTLNYSRLVRTEPEASDAIASGILVAWAVSLVRMTAVAVFLAPSLFQTLAPPIVAGAMVFAAAAFFFYWRAEDEKERVEIPLSEPFDLGLVLRFGLLLSVIVLAYKLTTAHFGAAGARPLAAIAGFADVDPITLSVAQTVKSGTSSLDAATQILIAASTNLATRMTIVAWTRNLRFALPLLGIAIAGLAALWATFWFFG
jgi:uncharacterized membrane protein (DUF4010 family)